MPLNPELGEVVEALIAAHLLELHTAIPGAIKSYDAAKQTAEVIIQVRSAVPAEDGSIVAETPPVIPNVPVQWPRGGGYALHFPLKPGDHVLLVFNEAAIGHWRASGQVADPGDLRRHSISYPVAIPGISPDASPIADAPAGEAVLTVGDGTFRVGGPSAELVALASKVNANFKALKDMFTTWLPVATDGGAALKTLTGSLSFDDVDATKLKAE
jgi:hypothetical protein